MRAIIDAEPGDGPRPTRTDLNRTRPNLRRWDLFCSVVDNFGDIGVCWRLAQQLANEHGLQIRLWVDDLESLACLVPAAKVDADEQRIGLIDVRRWTIDFPLCDVADVVIEAFACQLPAVYVVAMAQREQLPIWINLEYLSAEEWVEDCHQLASPQSKSRLTKHFFFPGFSSGTGGLLRENSLLATRDSFDRTIENPFWESLGVAPRINEELRVSLFCYPNPSLPDFLRGLAEGSGPVRLLVSPGAATDLTAQWIGEKLSPGAEYRRNSLTIQGLPFLPQATYDQLLWGCDVNFVRGEDSFVRAQWAQKPFVWQIYPQADQVHLIKLNAFLNRYLCDLPVPITQAVRRCWHAWNDGGEIADAWRDFVAMRGIIEPHAKVWARQLDRTGNLADNLVRFVRGT